MVFAFLQKVFGSVNDRMLKKLQPRVLEINALEPVFEKLSDAQLKAKTEEFKQRLAKGETLDNVLNEAFATVREAAKRTLGQRHYDVQILGGLVLHQGNISEMKTGEGKTLVSTLAVYLNALSGKGVHVVTVNDYLAKRDSEWMGQIYRFLGLTVDCVVHGLNDEERRAAYAADITYGTNNELGFDYLRDNMKFRLEDMVQREFNYAIVDEVDSILIDEARTPLIISGPAEDGSALYATVNKIVPQLSAEKGDFEKDEKAKSITLTDSGTENLEEILKKEGIMKDGTLYDLHNVSLVHHVNQALRAHHMFQKDKDYIVKDGKVVIIDEFTGRMMEGRRYSEGLHQSIEAKEHVNIQQENQTLASITFQNYFRLYPKLAGMTGTGMTEAHEFGEIYGLEVVSIPTNVTIQRVDHQDEIYATMEEKYDALIKAILDCHKRGQPVLVGTVSIEKSELLAKLLAKKKIKHNVLNARFHDKEAEIIAQAGHSGAITIATNMAGRGTDIQLGGNFEMMVASEGGHENMTEAKIKKIKEKIAADHKKVMEAGGLYVIGTERHESRRIDNQLRGRSGRQGDPGASKFFLSLEDDLMRIFGSSSIQTMMTKFGLEKGEAIIHPWISKALEKAQQKVEAHNFEIRKNLLKFDNVMNDQRKVIYEQRREIMANENVTEMVDDMRLDVIEDMVHEFVPPKAYPEQWDLKGLKERAHHMLAIDEDIEGWGEEDGIAGEEIEQRIIKACDEKLAEKMLKYGEDVWLSAQKSLLLQIMDKNWKDHLLGLDHLRQGIGLRAYAQKDPLNEYKHEAFVLFQGMLDNLRVMLTRFLMHVEIQSQTPEDLAPRQNMSAIKETRQDPAFAGNQSQNNDAAEAKVVPLRQKDMDPQGWSKVPRNAPCPCGSGKKYKHCHGIIA
jgi:preprotein translocase subunit SecA